LKPAKTLDAHYERWFNMFVARHQADLRLEVIHNLAIGGTH